MDFDKLQIEVERIFDSVSTGTSEHSDMWAEALAFECLDPHRYEYNPASTSFSMILASGIRIEFEPNERLSRVVLKFNWASEGREERKRVDRWLKSAVDGCVGILSKGHWKVLDQSASMRTLAISAWVSVGELNRSDNRWRSILTNSVRKAMEKLKFE